MYKGPWTVPIGNKRPKDETAPKRPMSAFFAFSNKRRAAVKAQMPGASNAEVSKALSRMWKEAPEELRRQYQEEEAELRQLYKVRIAAWRQSEDENMRRRQENAMKIAEQGASGALNTGKHFASVLPASEALAQKNHPLINHGEVGQGHQKQSAVAAFDDPQQYNHYTAQHHRFKDFPFATQNVSGLNASDFRNDEDHTSVQPEVSFGKHDGRVPILDGGKDVLRRQHQTPDESSFLVGGSGYASGRLPLSEEVLRSPHAGGGSNTNNLLSFPPGYPFFIANPSEAANQVTATMQQKTETSYLSRQLQMSFAAGGHNLQLSEGKLKRQFFGGRSRGMAFSSPAFEEC